MMGTSTRMCLVAFFVGLMLLVAPGGAWGQWVPDGTALCVAVYDQTLTTAVSDGAGGAIVAWQDNRSGNYDIYVQHVNSLGLVQWGVSGVALCTATGSQEFPRIVSDGSGGAIVTWQDKRSGNYDIYVRRVNSSGTPLWTGDGVALCTATGNQESPEICESGAGGAIVTWEDGRSGSYIYARRVNSSGTPMWTNDGVVVCDAVGAKYGPMICPDGNAGAFIAWSDGRGDDLDIYAQLVDDQGTTSWEDGVPVCDDTGEQSNVRICAAGGYEAIIVWEDGISGSEDIYAQCIDFMGVGQWGPGGVALCTASGSQLLSDICRDGSCGAIVTWEHDPTGSSDIYAQRVDYYAETKWTENGVAVCTATGHQWDPRICSDGSGGAIVTWFHLPNGSPPDIYVQRIDGSGTRKWTPNGVPLCTAPLEQHSPAICTDDAGGAIVAWEDSRSSNFDIYAQRITRAGNIGSDPVPVALPVAIVTGAALGCIGLGALRRRGLTRL